MGKHSQVSEFQLEGRFLGFAAEEGYKLKMLRLSTSSGECRIKLPKELRPMLYRTLTPGEWVQVSGYQKIDLLKGTVKLKAGRVIPIAPNQSVQAVPALAVAAHSLRTADSTSRLVDRPQLEPTHRRKPDTILVCQKSDCCKRGAKALMQMLQQELDERGLADQVTIRGTGCMKQCKAGPNLVMPDKSRHSRVRPSEVSVLIEQHFPDAHFPDTEEIAS